MKASPEPPRLRARAVLAPVLGILIALALVWLLLTPHPDMWPLVHVWLEAGY